MLMSRLCSFVSLMGFLLCAASAHAAEPAPAAPGPATIEVTAKLINIPGKFPADELYDYVYVMQYEVQGGPMDKQKIYVAHYKPRRARAEIDDKMKSVVSGSLKRFEVGALHKLTLSAEMRKLWKGAVVDEFFDTDRKAKRYFCLKAEPAGK
jgi:hypothetical protein